MQHFPLLDAAGWQVEHRPNRPSRYWKPPARPRFLRSIGRRSGAAIRALSRRRDIRDAAKHDVVFVNRDLLCPDFDWERRLFAANRNVVFDFDDSIFLGASRRDHIGRICREARWVTVGNEYLAEFARQFSNRVTILPTVVATDRYRTRAALAEGRSAQAGKRVRVGWLGSDLSIRETLYPHWEMLARGQKSLRFEFVICSWPKPVPPSGSLEWRYLPWSPQVEENIARHIDIGIMPLLDNEYQRGKCGLKLIQYMAAGLPVIASPVGVNRAIVKDGESGYLAADEDAWLEALEALVSSEERRAGFGLAGRRRCEAEFDLNAWFPRLLGIFETVAAMDGS
jgi:glycosyltransferase involved in cell wall biosynthesis